MLGNRRVLFHAEGVTKAFKFGSESLTGLNLMYCLSDGQLHCGHHRRPDTCSLSQNGSLGAPRRSPSHLSKRGNGAESSCFRSGPLSRSQPRFKFDQLEIGLRESLAESRIGSVHPNWRS
jgi:hypothetical protein